MSTRWNVWNDKQLSYSLCDDFKIVRDPLELGNGCTSRIWGYGPATPRQISLPDRAGNFDLAKEIPWLSKESTEVKREMVKKGAVDGTQRRNNDKRRMWRRQFPGDGYVWETDTSPGM